MTDPLGSSDTNLDLSHVPGRTTAKLADAGHPGHRHVETPSWPSPGRLIRVFLAALGAIIVAGWILSAFN